LGAALLSLVLIGTAHAATRLPADDLAQVAFPSRTTNGLESYTLAASGHGVLVLGIGANGVRRSKFSATAPHQRTSSHVLSFPGWKVGGVLAGADGSLYVLLGRSNPAQDDARIVIEVRKFDPSLRQVGAAQVNGLLAGGIYDPFVATTSSMALSGTTLLVHTARLIYLIKGDSAAHHQVNLSFAVDTTTMQARTTWAPYASHSFRQFVRAQNGDDAVYLDLGDAYPRALQLGVTTDAFVPGRTTDAFPCEDDGQIATCFYEPAQRTFDIWKFDGEIGDNYTGTSVTGFEVGTSHALTVGQSVPHDHPIQGLSGTGSLSQNAYLIATDTTTGAGRFSWLTTYRPTRIGATVGDPQLVPLGDSHFVILFTTTDGTRTVLHYRLIDEQGQTLAARTWRRRAFSMVGQGTLLGSRIYWVGVAQTDAHRLVYGDYLNALDVTDALQRMPVRR
jgi:hypothetical protein